MKKSLYSVLAGVFVACALAACGSVDAATPNESMFTGSPSAPAYDMDQVHTVKATPSQFVLVFDSGVSSEVFGDFNGQELAKLKAAAPVLKSFIQIGNSGVWIRPGASKAGTS